MLITGVGRIDRGGEAREGGDAGEGFGGEGSGVGGDEL